MADILVKYVQKGEMVDYTPGVNVSAGDVVVQGDLVGVALQDIAAGEQGALCIQGVFDWPKDSGSASAISAGTRLYWNASTEKVTTTAGSNKGRIYAVQDAAATATTVRALLLPGT